MAPPHFLKYSRLVLLHAYELSKDKVQKSSSFFRLDFDFRYGARKLSGYSYNSIKLIRTRMTFKKVNIKQ